MRHNNLQIPALQIDLAFNLIQAFGLVTIKKSFRLDEQQVKCNLNFGSASLKVNKVLNKLAQEDK